MKFSNSYRNATFTNPGFGNMSRQNKQYIILQFIAEYVSGSKFPKLVPVTKKDVEVLNI